MDMLPERESFLQQKLPLVTDKSVAFEQAAFEIAVAGHGNAHTENAAENMGKLFWLVDDICDFPEDIKERRRNSLLYYLVPEEDEINLQTRVTLAYKRIDKAIDELICCLRQLPALVANPLYMYMLRTIWDWGKNIRRQHYFTASCSPTILR